jgi:hypothetical protein
LTADTPSITINVVAGDNTLNLIAALRTDYAGDNDSIRIVINGDTSNTYLTRFLRVDTTSTNVPYSATTGWQLDYAANGATSTSGLYGYLNLKIPLASELQPKLAQYDSVTLPAIGAVPRLCLGSAVYPASAAVTQIRLTPVNGTNFVSGCRYTLIGMA